MKTMPMHKGPGCSLDGPDHGSCPQSRCNIVDPHPTWVCAHEDPECPIRMHPYGDQVSCSCWSWSPERTTN